MSEQIEDVQEPEPCSAETARGTLYDPPAYCEEPADPISGLCYWHDPDGAEADRQEQIAEERRAGIWPGP